MIDPVSIGLMAGGQILGGLLGGSAASKAAKQQAAAQREAAAMQLAASREANALISQMYGSQLGVQAPQLRAGQTALSALMSGMGLGPLQMQQAAVRPSGDVGGAPAGQYLDSTGRPYTGQTFTNAQGQTVDAAGQPLTATPQFQMPGITQEQAEAAASPYAGAFLEKFTGQDIYQDPSYQFRFSEGERALRARQAAGGNRFGGQALKDIVNYGQQAAAQEYGSAYERFMKQKEALYGRLAGLAGTAGTTASNLAQTGGQTAEQLGRNIMGGTGAAAGRIADAGTAIAGGTLGSTRSLVGGMQDAAGTWLANQYFNQINRGMTPGMVPSAPVTAGGFDYSLTGGGPVRLGPPGP